MADAENTKKHLNDEDGPNGQVPESGDDKRRKIYDELSEPAGPLTQEDVKYFRKQAIWRQMKFYKSKNDYNEQIIRGLEAKLANLIKDNQSITNLKLQIFKTFDVKESKELVDMINDIIQNKVGIDVKEIDEYIGEITKLEGENSVLKNSKVELEIKLEDIANKLFKQQERVRSESLNRVYKIKEETPEVQGVAGTIADSSGATNGIEEEQQDLGSSEAAIDSKEVHEIKELNEKYESKIQDLIKQKEELIEQIKLPIEIIKLETSAAVSIKSTTEADEKDTVIQNLTKKVNNHQEMINQELTRQIDTLKEQIKKHEEDLVRVRTIRDELINKVNLMERQATNETLLSLNNELNDRINFQDKCTDENTKEIIKELEESYKRLIKETHVKLLNKIEQENLIKKYQIEKTKADQKYFQIMKLKDNLIQENKILKLSNAKNADLIQSFEAIEQKYREKIDKYEEMKLINQKLIDSIKNDNKKLSQDNNLKSIESNKLVTKLNRFSEDFKGLKQENFKLSNKLEEKQVEILKLVKYKNLAQNSNGGVNVNEEELNGFRSMVKCSVCSKNWKDTAITVCGHVFCNQCTKERLNARLRRCPSCNKGFSSNDLLTIHL